MVLNGSLGRVPPVVELGRCANMGGASSTTGGTRSPTRFGASSTTCGTLSPHYCANMGGISSTTGGTRFPTRSGASSTTGGTWSPIPPGSVQVPPLVELAPDHRGAATIRASSTSGGTCCRAGVVSRRGVFWGVGWRSFFVVFVECVVCIVVLLRGGVLCCGALLWGWCFGIVGLWCFWSLVILVSGGKGTLELMVL